MKEKIINNWVLASATILAIIGFALMVCYALNPKFNDGNGIINTTIANDFGSFIGGVVGPIFSLAGMLLLYETIVTQRKLFQIQQFEARFFELVRYHRENVASLSYRIPSSEKGEIVNGNMVFAELKNQIIDLFNFISKHMRSKKWFENEEIVEKEAINCSFLILFFGVGENDRETLLEYLQARYKKEQIEILIEELRKYKTQYDKSLVFYGGHQSKLGYYFRHIFQTVRYADVENCISEVKREDMVKLFRAQMASSEQALLFFLSMSDLGYELKSGGLISKYELIKNVQKGYLSSINLKKYYKDINFDWERKLPKTQID